jgi:MFS family permease
MRSAPATFSGRGIGVLALLALSVFINYIDRGNLSIAAPTIKDELGLSASQLGILLASFFWTYACFQLASGWLVDRYNASWIFAGGFLLWSAATAATGLVHAFSTLIAVRLVLGMGESVAYPSYSKILAQHFPEERRGIGNAVITSGLLCGPGFGMLVGGVLIARFGWRPFFVTLGLVSLLWLMPWLRVMPRGANSAPTKSGDAPSLLQFARLRSAWATCAGLASVNYVSYFLITWLPFYLVRERQFSMTSMARIGGGAYFLAAFASALSGWMSDRWITRGGTPTRVRKTFTGGGMAAAALFLVLTALTGRSV